MSSDSNSGTEDSCSKWDSNPNVEHIDRKFSTDLTNTNRKSAFQPYKPTNTVLTNLQRGNTQAIVGSEICLTFYERAAQGEITDEMVKQFGDVDKLDDNQFTALHWACNYGQLVSAQILIRHGADVNKEGLDMSTPLILAASGGHLEIVTLLINAGALINHMDIVGNTALMYAAAGNHPHTTYELLTNDADPTLSNENYETAYSLAVQHKANLSRNVLENQFLNLLARA